uniref:F-box protein At2g02240 n=1 Tax=Anthurium amnicola TaxID=1678845 RepID=A0A1D1Y188_9ARAE
MEGPEATKRRGAAASGGGGGDVDRMPEDCLSLALSLTTPLDVCRSSAVSSAFLSAAKSDMVWGRFLPPDCQGILDRSAVPVMVSSRRELYFRLCDSILVDGGEKILWLEKSTGKKCYMLSARTLQIIWGGDNRYWTWVSVPDARFPEVAELLSVCWLEVKACISSRELSPGTRYGAYLVMRLSPSSSGLADPPQEVVISVEGAPSSTRRVHLQEPQRVSSNSQGGPSSQAPQGSDAVCVPRERGDGWMELEMGDFFVEAGGEELVEVWLRGWQSLHWKSGLIVHGIEFRPMP